MKRIVDKIFIENFKSIRKLELELKNINILVGANGARKSNFIAFFRMLNSFVEEEFQTYVKKRKKTSFSHPKISFVEWGYNYRI